MCRHFAKEVARWTDTLATLAATLTQWRTAQALWRALAPVFATAEAARVLAEASDAFRGADATLREAAEAAAAAPAALPYGTNHDTLDVLTAATGMLDTARGALGRLLASKRAAAPRCDSLAVTFLRSHSRQRTAHDMSQLVCTSAQWVVASLQI